MVSIAGEEDRGVEEVAIAHRSKVAARTSAFRVLPSTGSCCGDSIGYGVVTGMTRELHMLSGDK